VAPWLGEELVVGDSHMDAAAETVAIERLGKLAVVVLLWVSGEFWHLGSSEG